MTDQRRELHVLVPDGSGRALLATEHGRLPSVSIALGDGETTVTAARRIARSAWMLDTPVLDVQFDHAQSHDDEGEGELPTLVVLEAPDAGWPPPDGLRWLPLERARVTVPLGIQPWLDEFLAEWRGDRSVAALRPRWSRPGWYAAAAAWIRTQLAELGRTPTAPVEQVRHWGISSLMRVETDAGRVWFKAVFPAFGHEPAATALLHARAPGAVAPVLVVDVDEGWMLLDDVGAAVVADDAAADEAAVRRLVDLQRAFVDHTDELRRAGCAARPIADVAGQLGAVLADPVVRAWVDVTPERAAAVVDWLRPASAAVAALGLPDTLVHGDFHPENVAVVDGAPVIFDWSDAAVGHPFVDAVTWSNWFRDEPARSARSWQFFVDAWADVCPPERLAAARAEITGLGGAYHTVSYAGIVAGLEPLRRPELADGLPQFFGLLDAVVPR